MEKTITRTITTTTLVVKEIAIVDNAPVFVDLPNIVVEGKISKENANRIALKQYKGKQVAVVEQQEVSAKYEMPYSTFIQHATEVVEKEELEVKE